MWYGSDYARSLKIPNADKASGPVAPDNVDMFDIDGNWVGVLAANIEDEDVELEDAEPIP